jgi:DNA-binding transcriptional ArsR family regulator
VKLREKAISLRKEGYSYSFISAKTGLSKSTLSYHLQSIPYTPNKYTINTVGKARAQAGLVKSKAKRNSFLQAFKEANSDIGALSNRDLFMLGLGLYIGEGSKTQDIIRLVNTDYRVIKLFIAWLCAHGFTISNFMIRIHLYPDSNISAAEEYWLQKTGIPKSQFQSVYIDRRVNKDRKRSSVHVYGTAHVTIRSNGKKELGVLFSRKIGAWMNKVLQ